MLVLLGSGACAAEHQALKVLFTSASQDQTLVKAWRFATILDRLTADIFVTHVTDATASIRKKGRRPAPACDVIGIAVRVAILI